MTYKYIVCISGGIAAGKTEIIEELAEIFKDDPRVAFCNEPIANMMAVDCENRLDLFANFVNSLSPKRGLVAKLFEGLFWLGTKMFDGPDEPSDKNRYAFLFQHRMILKRVEMLQKLKRDEKVKVIISERSPFDDRNVFCQLLFENGYLTADEIGAIDTWLEFFGDEIKNDYIVHVKTSVDKCMDRIVCRGRDGEKYSKEYLEALEKKHDEMLDEKNDDDEHVESQTNVFSIDNDCDMISDEWKSSIDNLVRLVNDLCAKGKGETLETLDN